MKYSSEDAVDTYEEIAIIIPRLKIPNIYVIRKDEFLMTIFFGYAEDDVLLSFIFHFCDSMDKLMILKSNIAASFAFLFYQR